MRLSTTFPTLCLLALLFCCTILFQSCDDNCLNVSCANGASCVDGACECPNGYIGEFCQYATCAVMYCSANATCVEIDSVATCVCDCGYIGTYCDAEIRASLYGAYSATDICASDTYNYNVSIDNSGVGGRAERFRINGWGGFADPLIELFGEVCTPGEWMLRDTVFADPSATSDIVSITGAGAGTITENTAGIRQLSIEYVIDMLQETRTCEVVFTLE